MEQGAERIPWRATLGWDRGHRPSSENPWSGVPHPRRRVERTRPVDDREKLHIPDRPLQQSKIGRRWLCRRKISQTNQPWDQTKLWWNADSYPSPMTVSSTAFWRFRSCSWWVSARIRAAPAGRPIGMIQSKYPMLFLIILEISVNLIHLITMISGVLNLKKSSFHILATSCVLMIYSESKLFVKLFVSLKLGNHMVSTDWWLNTSCTVTHPFTW